VTSFFVNTIPGADMIYTDCHILPGYRHEEIEEKIEGITGKQAKNGFFPALP